MMSSIAGVGGFYLPMIYQKSQQKVEFLLSEGKIDYAELSRWSFPDEFLSFVLECDLLSFVDKTYPNPRTKNEVPIWFIITCQFLMRLHQTGHYQHLDYLLNAGSILTRFGFNVGSKKIGFNDKNKKPRKTALVHDTVRKFFRDTLPQEIRLWHNHDLQKWFRAKQAFNHQGIFILDQSHLVVPDNENYKDAVKMPVDEHGQLYSNLNTLTQEQRKSLIYHRCYALSVLLNASTVGSHFHVAGYELGSGNEDELAQAENLIPSFCRRFPGVIKELIVDRGYIDGEFFSELKKDHDVNVLIPLRKNMTTYHDAIELARRKKSWIMVECQKSDRGKILFKREVILIKDVDLWESSICKQQVTVSKDTVWNLSTRQYDEHYFVLASTEAYSNPLTAIEHYQLRVQVEERFRQLKHSWYITEFPSPHASLVESHVCFTLFTYSLMQYYLRRNDLQEKTQKMIATLRKDEKMGKDAVLVYSGVRYGVFDLDDYTARVAGMDDLPRQRLKAIMESQKEVRLKREQA
jgi:Transposase DDE domain